MKYILSFIFVIFLISCSALEKYATESINKSADKAASFFDKYCKEMDKEHREKMRKAVNSNLKVAKQVKVDC